MPLPFGKERHIPNKRAELTPFPDEHLAYLISTDDHAPEVVPEKIAVRGQDKVEQSSGGEVIILAREFMDGLDSGVSLCTRNVQL